MWTFEESVCEGRGVESRVRLLCTSGPGRGSPPQRTLCAGAFVSKLFVSRSPSLHHLHTYIAFHSQSPRGQSLKPQPAARAVEDAIA